MKINKCMFCGSDNTAKQSSEKSGVLPDGTPFKYHSEFVSCLDCGTSLDAEGSDDQAYLAAYKAAEKQSLEIICKELSDKGYSMAYVERAFRLPQRTIGRWKAQGISASGMALMSLIRALPWIATVADHNYDRAHITKEVVSEAAKLISEAATAGNYYTRFSVLTSGKSLAMTAHFVEKQPCPAIQADERAANVVPLIKGRQSEVRAEA